MADLDRSYDVVAFVSRSITLGAEVLPEIHSSAVSAASRDGAGGKMLSRQGSYQSAYPEAQKTTHSAWNPSA